MIYLEENIILTSSETGLALQRPRASPRERSEDTEARALAECTGSHVHSETRNSCQSESLQEEISSTLQIKSKKAHNYASQFPLEL